MQAYHRFRRLLPFLLLPLLLPLGSGIAADNAPDAPTWAACRILLQRNALAPAPRSACDALHRRPPGDVTLGLRLVFVNHPPDPAWIGEALALLDAVYASAGLRFRVDATVSIRNARVDASDGVHRLRETSGDVAQHLGLAPADRGNAVAALRRRLEGALVSPRALDAQLRKPELRTDEFWRLLARAFPESIYVVIHPGMRAGGNSSGPAGTIEGAAAGIVELRPDAQPRTLAHEIGHYFGLHHTHARSASAEPTLDFERLASRAPGMQAHLRGLLGPDFEAEWPDPFLAYDASAVAQQEHERRFTAASLVAPLPDLHYKAGFAPFRGLGDFLRHVTGGAPAYRVNFVRSGRDRERWRGNNCRFDRRRAAVICVYGGGEERRAEHTLRGSHPVLRAGMTRDDGRAVNLMSYVGSRVPGRAAPRPFLTAAQLDVVRRGLLQPPRLHLRHH